MGSWEATCMATRSPIHRGDPVVGFFLHGSGLRYHLASVPLYGEYVDYGEFTLDPMSEPVVEFQLGLCQTWKASRGEYNQGEDPEVLQDYIRFAERTYFCPHQMKLEGHHYTTEWGKTVQDSRDVEHTVPITLGMCHRSAFDILFEYGGPVSGGVRFPPLPDILCQYAERTFKESLKADTDVEEWYKNGLFWGTFAKVHPDVFGQIAQAIAFQNGMTWMRRLLLPDTHGGHQSTDDVLGVEFDLAKGVIERAAERLGLYEEENDG